MPQFKVFASTSILDQGPGEDAASMARSYDSAKRASHSRGGQEHERGTRLENCLARTRMEGGDASR